MISERTPIAESVAQLLRVQLIAEAWDRFSARSDTDAVVYALEPIVVKRHIQYIGVLSWLIILDRKYKLTSLDYILD